MPVGTLLCEGVPGGPDVRLLSLLLGNQVLLKPAEGKYGMGNRILAWRESRGRSSSVYGLLDGDFPKDWQPPLGRPVPWNGQEEGQTIHFGWRWERKEIENYLIDPAVALPLLGARIPDHSAYCAALENARDRLAAYQAARWALSRHRPRFIRLANDFSPQQVQQVTALSDTTTLQTLCHEQMRGCLSRFAESQQVDAQIVIQDFDRIYLPDCVAGGQRHRHYLAAFAGKDLLRQLEPTLLSMRLKTGAAFLETVLEAASLLAGDLGSLLPEWKALRELMTIT